MASGITTAQQLVDILDAIYNNVEQYDTYTGADGTLKGSLRLYYNEITKTATIFKRHLSPLDPLEPSYDYVVCTFNPENVVTANDETFLCKVMKNVAAGAVTYANDIALGAYVGVKTLLRNICAALGVNMAANFDELQPQLYEDMLNIIKKYYGSQLENNAPYGLARKDIEEGGTTTTTYHSYIPVMIIVEIAIYLNNLGVFNVDGDTELYNPGVYINGINGNNYQRGIGTNLSLRIIYETNNNETYFRQYKEYTKYALELNNVYNDYKDIFEKCLNAIISQYDSELDSNDLLVATSSYSTSSLYKTFTINIRKVPMSCIYGNYDTNTGASLSTQRTSGTWTYLCNYIEDFSYTVFALSVKEYFDTTPDEITNSKTVVELLKDTLYNDKPLGGFNNLKKNKYIKNYYQTVRTASSTSSWYYDLMIDGFGQLQNNTVYDNLKFNGIYNFLMTTWFYYYYIFDKGINDNDFAFDVYHGNEHYICIVKNITDISCNNLSAFSSSTYSRTIPQISKAHKRHNDADWTYYDLLLNYARYYSSTNNNIRNAVLSFTTPTNILIYKINDLYSQTGTIELVNDITVSSFNINDLDTEHTGAWYLACSNLGEVIEIAPGESFEGLTLQEGATYPTSVIDLNSFNATYPNWQQIGYSQPYFEDDELENTYTAQWATISVDKTPPTSQNTGQSGIIDLTDVDDVIEDIDNAEEGNDDEETDPNDNTNDGDDGDTPQEDNVGDLPSALGGGFIKQYMLTESEMQAFATQLITPNFWTSVNMFLSDPMDAVISLQAGYLFNTQGATSQQLVFNGYTFSSCTGTLLQTNYLDIDLGTINIGEKFQNYQDITNTQLEIFLPYIGYVNLEIGDFLNGAIHLRARIDTLTGTIVYSIYSERDGAKQLTHQISGNCQVQLPIKSEDHSSLLRSLIHSNKIGG